MTKLYYRGMIEKNGQPKLGRSACLLGIRPSVDIDVVHVPQGHLDSQGYLLLKYIDRQDVEVPVEVAIRNKKGFSVSLSIQGLPPFRKPAAFGGTGKDALWQIDDSYINGDLEAVQDSETHVSILPSATMLLSLFEAAIEATQPYWKRVN